MSEIIISEVISRRRALSLVGLAAALGLAAPAAVLTASDAEARPLAWSGVRSAAPDATNGVGSAAPDARSDVRSAAPEDPPRSDVRSAVTEREGPP
jgi:hypothetical protein